MRRGVERSLRGKGLEAGFFPENLASSHRSSFSLLSSVILCVESQANG
jgi:hypothetical protein